MRSVRFHPAARRELLDALRWYEKRSELAASALRHEIDHAVERLLASPEQFPRTESGARRFVLLRFPFSVVYWLTDGEIVIVALAHHKRRPDYWVGRHTA